MFSLDSGFKAFNIEHIRQTIPHHIKLKTESNFSKLMNPQYLSNKPFHNFGRM